MNKNINLKKKKTLHRFVFSHVLIVMICCIAAGILLFSISEKTLRQEEEEHLRSKMQLVLKDLQIQYETVKKIVGTIKSQRYYRPSYLQVDNLNELEMIRHFSDFSSYSPLIEEYYLVYVKSEKIYSSKSRFSYESLLEDRLMLNNPEEVLEKINQTEEFSLLYMDDHRSIFIYPIHFTGIAGPEGRAMLLVVIPYARLQERIATVSSLDASNAALCWNGQMFFKSQVAGKEKLTLEMDGLQMIIGREGQSIASIHLMKSGIQLMLLIMLVMCMLALAAAFSNYSPIKQMLNLTGGANSEDEFEHLRNTFLKMREQNILSEKELDENLQELRQQKTRFGQYLLLNVLNGEIDAAIIEQLKMTGILFNGRFFRVLVLAAEEKEQAAVGRDVSVWQEKMGVRRYSIPLSAPYGMAILENAAEEAFLYQQNMGEILSNCQQAGKYHSVGVGCICDGIEDLPVSFAMAIEKLSQPDVIQHTGLMRLDIFLKKFQSSVKNEGFTDSAAQLKNILQEDIWDDERRICYLQARLAAIFLQYDEDGKISGAEIQRIWSARHAAEMEQAVQGILKHMEGKYEQKTQTMEARVLDFIRRNCTDGQFNLDLVVQACDISERQVRKIVLEMTGMNFLDYVKMLKIEKAKRMLREEKMSVNEICQSTGYSATSYFIQLFKKMTGYTPKQYQEIAGNNGNTTEDDI